MTILSYCSSALPGRDLDEKVESAQKAGVAMDLEVRVEDLKYSSVLAAVTKVIEVPTLIAYDCHGMNLLSSAEHRKQFTGYMKQVAALAQHSHIPRVLMAIYEKSSTNTETARRVLEEIAQMFTRGTMLLIEPLDRQRTVFLPAAAEMAEFVRTLGSEKAGLALDTGHMHSTEGQDFYNTLEELIGEAAVLQLKDTKNGESWLPPGKGGVDWNRVGSIVRNGNFSGPLTVECKQFPNYDEFRQNVRFVRERIGIYR